MRRTSKDQRPQTRARSSFNIISHTSEVGLRLRAPTWAGLLRVGAEGLLALYKAEGDPAGEERARVELTGETREELLVAWLNELVFLVSAKRFLPTRVRLVRAGPEALRAELAGGLLGENAGLAVEVKAATYHGLKVRRRAGEWRATVILDV